MDAQTIDPSKFKPLDMAKRSVHFERRKQDEAEVLELVMQAQQVYNCSLIPSMENGTFQMLVQSRDPDSEETQQKINLFSQYLQQVCADYQVEFTPVLHETDPAQSGVYLLTTW